MYDLVICSSVVESVRIILRLEWLTNTAEAEDFEEAYPEVCKALMLGKEPKVSAPGLAEGVEFQTPITESYWLRYRIDGQMKTVFAIGACL